MICPVGPHVAGIVRGARLEHEGCLAQERENFKDAELSLVGCSPEPIEDYPLSVQLWREAKDEELERKSSDVVTPKSVYSEPSPEPIEDYPLSVSTPGEEAKDEELERKSSDVVTPKSVYSEPSPEPIEDYPLSVSTPGEEAKDEELERKSSDVVTPKSVYSEPSPEPIEDYPLSVSTPGEEAKDEELERKSSDVVTPKSVYSEPALVEKEREQIALSEIQSQTQGELFRGQEQEEQLRHQVEELQENDQNIKAESQAELPEAEIAITAVKRRHKEAMRNVQEEMNLHEQRGDQQNQVSARVSDTPFIEYFTSFYRTSRTS
ncbi:uncharacterized protein LOC117011210 [Catharus ustulatus]|uniref:uncharacterized protein LOC117011210 n=1 Tax=Catharus ustulatus TaxID=91951 RepID=UPI00140CCAC5|nr:uncharacterized protein LOC117011210 [Catharus ustulatus]